VIQKENYFISIIFKNREAYLLQIEVRNFFLFPKYRISKDKNL